MSPEFLIGRLLNAYSAIYDFLLILDYSSIAPLLVFYLLILMRIGLVAQMIADLLEVSVHFLALI